MRRWVYGNVVVWTALLLSVLWFRTELIWSVEAITAQLRGYDFPVQPQWESYDRAHDLWENDGDLTLAAELLEASLAIEPNVTPTYLLGKVHLALGHEQQALERLLQAEALDPSHHPIYLKLFEIYTARDQPELARQALARGVARFEKLMKQSTPQPDGTVWHRYNAKAADVHAYYVKALDILQTAADSD
jgi:tetratricopeptide (TPR) repeat protein